MLGLYKLVGKMAIKCNDSMEWAEWMQTANKRVALDEIGGAIMISTIFLGLDHNFSPAGLAGRADPLLFETMTFVNHEPSGQWRYFTWAEAEEGHKKLVEIIKAQDADAEFLTKDALRELMQKARA